MPPEISRHKELAISFMPRKAPYEAGLIKDIFHRCYPELDGVEWIEIDGQSHSEAMKRLGRTALFLSLAHREGFGLPPIEAMSLRTLVVGFHGGGGLEYATSRNGYWLNEGELVQCAQELKSCLELIRRGAREISEKLDQGQLTASYFDVSRMKTRLIEFGQDDQRCRAGTGGCEDRPKMSEVQQASFAFTYHGSVLYVTDDGELRHGRLSPCRSKNLRLANNDLQARLVHLDGRIEFTIRCGASGCWSMSTETKFRPSEAWEALRRSWRRRQLRP